MLATMRNLFLIMLSVVTALASSTATAASLKSDASGVRYEKIYLMTDRSGYLAGDTLWVRAFVADEVTHRPMNKSKFVYVELRDAANMVVRRVKLMERDGVYAGYVPLDEGMLTGRYMLTGYTMFAQNAGEKYFPKTIIDVVHPFAARQRVDVELTPDGDKTKVHAHLTDRRTGERIGSERVTATSDRGDMEEKAYYSSRGVSVKVDPAERASVDMVFDSYGETVVVPLRADTMVRMAPEGGALIAGEPNRVSLAVWDANGRALAAKVAVVAQNGDTVATAETNSRGIGEAVFTPAAGGVYTARTGDASAEPEPCGRDAVALRMERDGDEIRFRVAGAANEPMKLLIAQHGNELLYRPLTEQTITIDRKVLRPGIVEVRLLRPDGSTATCRPFFVSPAPTVSRLIMPDAPEGKIRLELDGVRDGSLAVSVIDASKASAGTGDIMSAMLLQSEWPEITADPAAYMSDPALAGDLDLMLMGSRRLSRFEKPRPDDSRYPLEIGSVIRGQVRTRWTGKPKEGATVMVMSPGRGYGDSAETDGRGEFEIDGYDFPDSTIFFFRVVNDKDKAESNFHIRHDSFPAVAPLPRGMYMHPAAETADNDLVARMTESVPSILLDEIVVNGIRLSGRNGEFDHLRSIADRSYDRKYLETNGLNSFEAMLRTYPGMAIYNNMGVYRGRGVVYIVDGKLFDPDGRLSNGRFSVKKAPMVPNSRPNPNEPPVLDGRPMGVDIREITGHVPFDDIERIDFVEPEYTSYLSNEAAGLFSVMIWTRSGSGAHRMQQPDFGMQVYAPLGYQQRRERAPYDPEDMLSAGSPTVYWNPEVRVRRGKAEFEAVLPDVKEGRYLLRIEGMTDDGIPFAATHPLQ